MGKMFVFSFIGVAFVYAFLSSCTTILYRNKSIEKLGLLEIKILRGEATITDRFFSFLTNFALKGC